VKHSIKLTVYRTWEEVDNPHFLAQWENWLNVAPSAHVFIHPVIAKTWTDIYRTLQDITPLYCIAEIDNIIIFLPLVIWQRNWKNAFIRLLVPVGYSDYDYHDPLVTGNVTEKLMQFFWDFINEKVFRNERRDFDAVDLSGIHFPGSHTFWVKDGVCPFRNLAAYENFDHFLSSLPKNLRKDIRRRRRQLAEIGELSFHVYNKDQIPEAIATLTAFIEVHNQKWPKAYKALGFHEAILKNGLQAELVHFSQIRIDDQPISWELGFRYRQRAYSYMPAYLECFSKYSPGKVHLSYLIEDCYRNGTTIFDYMRGSETYKSFWADSKEYLYSYHEVSNGMQSRIKLLVNKFILDIKRKIYLYPIYIMIPTLLNLSEI
jgi:CelD/BcsL family acetyltransferase involved in cellulose biosynthesis